MATLTWRNVDAPDFRTSLEGIKSASELFGNAIGTAQAGLTGADNTLTSNANRAFAMRVAQMQDAEAAKAALVDGSIFSGMDPRRISAESIAAAQARPTQLIQQAAAGVGLDRAKVGLKADNLGLETNQYTFDRTKTDNFNLDSAKTDVAKYIAATQAGGQGVITEAMTKLTPDQLLGVAKGGSGLQNDYVGRDSTRAGTAGQLIQNETGNFNLQTSKEDRAIDNTVAAAITRANSLAADPQGRLAALQSMGLDPRVYVRAEAAVLGRGEDPGFSASGAIAGAAGSGDGMDVMNYQARGKGFTSVPAGIKTIGQMSAYADSINAAGVPSSAAGPYQIVGNTRDSVAKQIFGSNWRNQPYSIENETKIATAIFNANKGSADALRKQWVSLSPAEAERVRKMPVNQALAVIAGKESSSSPAVLQQQAQGTQNSLRQQSTRNQSTGVLGIMTDTKLDPNEAPVDVANRLAKTSMKGASPNAIQSDIEDVYQRAKGRLSYAQAGEVVRRSVTPGSTGTVPGFFSGLYNKVVGMVTDTGERGSNRYRNPDREQQMIEALTTSNGQRAIADQQNVVNASAGLAQAQAAAQVAQAEYNKAVVYKRDVKPNLDISRQASRLAAARNQLKMAEAAARPMGDNGDNPQDTSGAEALARSLYGDAMANRLFKK